MMRSLAFSVITMLCACGTTPPSVQSLSAPPQELSPAQTLKPYLPAYSGTGIKPAVECETLLECWTTWKRQYLEFLQLATPK